MAIPKTMTGARAKIFIQDILVGLFDSCSYAVNVGAEPIHILGRYSASEIAQTSYEAVTVNCSGFRLIGNGGHVLPKMPKLQDLLQLEGIRISIVDRQDNENGSPQEIMNVINCVPINYSTGYQARATSRIQITYLGTIASDEAGEQVESAGAVDLP